MNENNGIQMVANMESKETKNLLFRDMKYFVIQGRAGKKLILKGISGEFKAGELSAIMGPSGAGKSSLMNILAGYCTKNVIGDVYVSSLPRNMQQFRKMSCYIMQDDLLLPHLSVDEAMMCSANLKLSEKTSYITKRKIVDNIINLLGLREAVHTRTSQLSGGQKKRLAIAQELVNNPPIMFFDEPTSGLDSASCFHCISLLRRLARGGRTIICTIHQPSAKIFELFDHLYFLTDGHCIYRGPVSCLVPYLATQNLICPPYHNPADYFMEVACGEYGDHYMRLAMAARRGTLDEIVNYLKEKVFNSLTDNKNNECPIHNVQLISDILLSTEDITKSSSSSFYLPIIKYDAEKSKSSREPEIMESPPQIEMSVLLPQSNGPVHTISSDCIKYDDPSREFAANQLTQFRVLFVRNIFSILRDSTLTHLRFVSHIVVGILIGLLYFRIGNLGYEVISNAAFVFFTLLFLMFAALMPTVMTFPLEISIFFREHLNSWYSLKAYYMAKSLADVPFQIFFPIVYASITYWMTEQPNDASRFIQFLVISVQTSLVGQSLGLVIGTATSLQVAVFLGPVTGIPILLFSGFFLSLYSIPRYLQWISFLSFTRYSFSGALKILYGNNRTNLDCNRKRINQMSYPCLGKPALIFQALNIPDYNVSIDFSALCIFFIFLRILGYYILRWRVRRRR
ncbi:ATP-binding cassette sub-family G member 1 [Schistosoma japonicum]|uniref:ATP-binding cassette sub-family G member 1 n=1 Tax=Schistosoma japonicum TaxID=6182 RepID=A0A4Z2D488_SCHJA|nr:ATP-binding cassette sub-family G member 1 [Schistosoma japonicum]